MVHWVRQQNYSTKQWKSDWICVLSLCNVAFQILTLVKKFWEFLATNQIESFNWGQIMPYLWENGRKWIQSQGCLAFLRQWSWRRLCYWWEWAIFGPGQRVQKCNAFCFYQAEVNTDLLAIGGLHFHSRHSIVLPYIKMVPKSYTLWGMQILSQIGISAGRYSLLRYQNQERKKFNASLLKIVR